MPILLPSNRLADRCGVSPFDSVEMLKINNLAGEYAAMFTPQILPEILADSAFTSAISVPIMDLIAAEYIEYTQRIPGAMETVTVGDLRVEPAYPDTQSIRKLAFDRLRPFLQEEFITPLPKVATDEGAA